MKTVTGYSIWHTEECARSAREGFKSLCANPFEAHYLWYKTLSLVVAPDKPDATYELGDPQRVPGDLTVMQLTAWIHTRSTRLSILPADE